VLVTGNYKLSLDAVRKRLQGSDVWLLVIDTRGINVWCAAGKGTFSAEEIAYQVHKADLSRIVTHRELLLPQLSANGVAAHELKSLCGFRGRFGPITAADLPRFLKEGQADEEMRTITFTLAERAVLIPLEICMLWKLLGITIALAFIFSGVSPNIFSIDQAIQRGILLVFSSFTAIIAGAVAAPLLLPWLPFRQFWLKGAVVGLPACLPLLYFSWTSVGFLERAALCFWTLGVSSYLTMNFTGSTPFTSLSGVSREMRKGLVFQISSTILALTLWLADPFV
jgi:hypothetical protein